MKEKPKTLHSSILEFLNIFIDNEIIINYLLDGLSAEFDTNFVKAMTQLSTRYQSLRDSLNRDSLSGKWPLIFPPACLDDFALVDMQQDVSMPSINDLKTTIYFDENNKVQVGYELNGESLDRQGFSSQELVKIRKYLDARYLDYLKGKGVELRDGKFYKADAPTDAEIDAPTFEETYFPGSEAAYKPVTSNPEIHFRGPGLDTLKVLSQQEQASEPRLGASPEIYP